PVALVATWVRSARRVSSLLILSFSFWTRGARVDTSVSTSASLSSSAGKVSSSSGLPVSGSGKIDFRFGCACNCPLPMRRRSHPCDLRWHDLLAFPHLVLAETQCLSIEEPGSGTDRPRSIHERSSHLPAVFI